VWEDALLGGLVEVANGGTRRQSEVVLTPRGRAVLEESLGQKPTLG
jgi:hypothetical protein